MDRKQYRLSLILAGGVLISFIGRVFSDHLNDFALGLSTGISFVFMTYGLYLYSRDFKKIIFKKR